ncbi:MAG TPA: DUF58 domain-containing protein [Methanoregulaceae archaeon]|nr:DUF58 domain-containing protein [Methanoregulaceae archaeon]
MTAVILGIVGLYLDSLAATISAVGLASLLCSQAVLFLYHTSRYTDSITIERKFHRRPVVAGRSIEVEVQVNPPSMDGLKVHLADLPPAPVVYSPENTSLENGHGVYIARFLVPGATRFRGLQVITANRFFSTTLTCTSPRYAGDEIFVSPREGRVRDSSNRGMPGTKELKRRGIWKGEGVSGFHPFRHGDDLSLIDWKLSAKHRRPYVREPSATMGGAPLLIVDLPRSGSPHTPELLLSVSEALARMVKERGRCSLLLISGGDVIDLLQNEHDLNVVYRCLGIRIHESFHPLYRMRDSLVLRSLLRSAENGKLAYSRYYAAALRSNLSSRRRIAFEDEVDHALMRSEQSGVVVYTASTDDLSHLNLIAEAARRRKSRLVIRLPRSLGGCISWLSPYPVVELI